MSAPRPRTAVAALALACALIPVPAAPQGTLRHLNGATDARGCATQPFRARASGVVERFVIDRAERQWRNAVHAGGYGRAFQPRKHGFVHHAICARDVGILDCSRHVTPCRVNINAGNRRPILWDIR